MDAQGNTTPFGRFLFLRRLIEIRETFMRSKFVFSALAAAALLGAGAFVPAASAAEGVPGANVSAKAGTSAPNAMAMDSTPQTMHHHTMHHHTMHHTSHHHHTHNMGYSRRQMDETRPGGKPVSRKAPD